MNRIFCILILLLTFLGCKEGNDVNTLYLAHSLPQAHPVHKGIVEFQKSILKKSNGKLDVKIFPDGQLGSEREVLELIQIGSVAITKVSAATLSNFVPSSSYKVTKAPGNNAPDCFSRTSPVTICSQANTLCRASK